VRLRDQRHKIVRRFAGRVVKADRLIDAHGQAAARLERSERLADSDFHRSLDDPEVLINVEVDFVALVYKAKPCQSSKSRNLPR
jgi:hypothetical protein